MEDIAEIDPRTNIRAPAIPDLFTTWPPVRDELETETSELQDETVRECLPFLDGSVGAVYNEDGVPILAREKHVEFLRDSLERMPAGFVGLDASRPWIIYWALTALSLMGEDIEQYRERSLSHGRLLASRVSDLQADNVAE
ncbi:MAG: hypothetical protein Q9170_006388 [Blastenia crenularia]